MDPDETLRRIRRITTLLTDYDEETSLAQLAARGVTLAVYIQTLDEWISEKHGRPPADWTDRGH